VAALPEPLRATISAALARLVDYQDLAYARRYLERLGPFATGDAELALIVARHLAVWMTYEDAIRVAQLKTRWDRFERIRRDARDPAAEVVVTDYLKPDLDEIYGILPAVIGRPIARWAERRWPAERPSLGQHVRTTTVLGFLRVWLLGRLRFLRPRSLRAEREWALIERWRAAVLAAAALDTELAVEVAEAAAVVRGYGEVRRRLSGAFARLLDEIVAPAMARDRDAGAGYARARGVVAEARRLLLADEKGIDAAVALAAARA
jgi:indolepyruvate ferredoxin oxidoreductase beta subunit